MIGSRAGWWSLLLAAVGLPFGLVYRGSLSARLVAADDAFRNFASLSFLISLVPIHWLLWRPAGYGIVRNRQAGRCTRTAGHEEESSRHNALNALAPDGSTFEDAETVMYAVALYKPNMAEVASLDALIADDKKKFIEHSAAVSIAETKPIVTGDGQKLRSFTFFPKAQGNWEQVSYGEEGEYYLIFTVSSRTKSGYEQALQSYEAMLRAYKAKL